MNEAGYAHTCHVSRRAIRLPRLLRPLRPGPYAAVRGRGIIGPVSSTLSAVPARQRLRAANVAALFAVLLLVVGVLPWFANAPASVRVLASVSLLGGVGLTLITWGLRRSVTLDGAVAAALEFDAVVSSAVAEAGGGCGCGHEHNPDDLTFADEPAEGQAQIGHATGSSHPHDCAAAGSCDQSCASCALGALRS